MCSVRSYSTSSWYLWPPSFAFTGNLPLFAVPQAEVLCARWVHQVRGNALSCGRCVVCVVLCKLILYVLFVHTLQTRIFLTSVIVSLSWKVHHVSEFTSLSVSFHDAWGSARSDFCEFTTSSEGRLAYFLGVFLCYVRSRGSVVTSTCAVHLICFHTLISCSCIFKRSLFHIWYIIRLPLCALYLSHPILLF